MLLFQDDADPAASEAVSRGLSVAELIAWADTLDPASEVNRAQLLTSVGAFLEYADRLADAVPVLEEAVADGGEVVPDARVYLATALLRLGEEERAGALFDAVRHDRPTDPLVYEIVGEAWEMRDELATAEHWFMTGWNRCLKDESADMANTLMLLVGRRRVRLAQGLGQDHFDEVAEEYLAANRRAHVDPGPLVQGFVPAGEWEAWPTARPPGADFEEQVLLLERVLRSTASGRRVTCVPLEAAGLAAYAAEAGLEPDGDEARWGYLDLLADQGRGRSWPPGRNEPCWCGSERKYKKCCGRPMALD